MAAAAALLPGRLGVIAWWVLFLVTVIMFRYQVLPAALAHFFAVLAGGALGRYAWRPQVMRGDAANVSLVRARRISRAAR
jgi:hypothetical protein